MLFVWDGDYPWDIRVEKVCDSLLEGGHEVHLVCRNLGRQQREERYRGLHLHRLPYLPRALGKLNQAFTFPAFFSPVWLWQIFTRARRHRCQLVIVRDLPMAPAAIAVARLLGTPCVLDMAESYPEMLRCIRQFEGFAWRNLLLRSPALAGAVERAVLRRVDRVLVMVEESRDRLLRLGVDPQRIEIVSNTPVLKRSRAAEERAAPPLDRGLRVVYLGILNPSRGLDTVLGAVERYARRGGRISLTVIGTGKDEPELRNAVAHKGLQELVEFTGWIDNQQALARVRDSDVGIVPHHRCGHWDSTIPNKLFDYMAAGMPVIVSDARPAARIVEESGAGIVYPDGDEEALAEAFRSLEDPKRRSEMGRRGRCAVEEKYNWSNEEVVLLQVMDALAPADGSR
jgi:glycosyltransferase involved in cell wall biosynthesis